MNKVNIKMHQDERYYRDQIVITSEKYKLTEAWLAKPIDGVIFKMPPYKYVIFKHEGKLICASINKRDLHLKEIDENAETMAQLGFFRDRICNDMRLQFIDIHGNEITWDNSISNDELAKKMVEVRLIAK